MQEFIMSLIAGCITGIFSIIAVILTNMHNRKLAKNERNIDSLNHVITFYYLLLEKVNKTVKIKADFKKDKVVPKAPIYTENDNFFLYNRLEYVFSAVEDDCIRELIAFMSNMQQLEEARKRNVDGSYSSEFEAVLEIACVLLYNNKEKDNTGIINILGSLENYIVINQNNH